MKKSTFFRAIFASIYFIPIVAYAQFNGVKRFLNAFSGLINPIIRVIFGLAVIYFFWGMAQFILHAGDQKTRTDGKNKMIWGVVALFVMFSIWGILSWIGGVFGIGDNSWTVTAPPASNLEG